MKSSFATKPQQSIGDSCQLFITVYQPKGNKLIQNTVWTQQGTIKLGKNTTIWYKKCRNKQIY